MDVANRGLGQIFLLLLVLATPVAAQELLIDLSQAPTAAPTVQVPASGLAVPITILRGATKPDAAVRVEITPFQSATGEPLRPLLAADAAGKGETAIRITPGQRQLLTVYLLVPPPPGPGPYNGSVFVFVDGVNRPGGPFRQPMAITASNPSRPATLQIVPEGDTRVLEIANPFSRSYSPGKKFDPTLGPAFDIRLGDAAGRWKTTVEVGPATVTKAPDNLNLSDHSAFFDTNGTRLLPPFTIPEGGQTIKMQLGGLAAGEYHVTIPFIGANASNEPRKYALVINARHSIWYAIATLVVALLLSFAASKAVSIRTERVKLLKRIDELRPFWLQNEPPTMAVVWVQSIVAQASQLSKRWILRSLETINQRLDTAEALLQAIDRLRRVRGEIKQTVLPRFAKARAYKLAERIGDRLDPDMGQAELTEIATAITDLRGWTRQDEWVPRYIADLSGSINQVLAEVDPEAIPAAHRQAIVTLVDTLKTPMPAQQDLEQRERDYAALKIMWERRANAEFADLVALLDAGIDQIFKKADETAWTRLKAQGTKVRFGLTSHRSGQQPEAFDPLTFRLTAGTPALDATFLVMHGLTYEWKFDMYEGGQKVALTPVTRGPQVPLFAPFEGDMTPSVTLVNRELGEKVVVQHGKVKLSPSTQFALRNSVSIGEVVQLGLAFIVAAISGLQAFYFKSAGFGSLADYMALFAWGATVDQAKNLAQQLHQQSAPANPTIAPAPVPAAGPPAPVPPQPPPPPAGGGGAPNPAPPNPQAPGGQAAPQPPAPKPPASKPPVPKIDDPPRPAFLDLSQLKIKKPEE